MAKTTRSASSPLRLTSMIDVVFLLLIYFMVTTGFAVGEGVITGKLPADDGVGSAPRNAPVLEPLVIHVAAAGQAGYRLRVGDQGDAPANFGQLRRQIEPLRYAPQDRPNGLYQSVTIQADSLARWQHAVNAFNAAVLAGYTEIRFAPSR